jgi:hypothetical protein
MSPFFKGRERGIFKSSDFNKISPHPSLEKRGKTRTGLPGQAG